MSKFKNFSSNRAITLIALITTIIVMLVLVGVSVSILVESDLIGAAEKAGDKFKSEQEKEQTLGQITIGNKTYASIGDYINNNPITGDGETGGDDPETPVDPDGPTDPEGGDEDVDLLPGERATDGNGTFMGIPIPEGFTVSNIPGEHGDTTDGVNGGIVIYDIPSTVDTTSETFWTAETTVGEGDSAQTYPTVQVNYNQFVWVPVAEAYITAAEISKIITDNSIVATDDYTANQQAINYLASQGRYPMAVQIPAKDAQGNDTVMYRGILYNFAAGTNGVNITSYADFSISAADDYTQKTYYREPAYLTDDDYADASGYNTIGLTQEKLQEEYNSMVESVADNGGFYVARYELTEETVDSTKVFGTKRGKTVADNAILWYGLYEKCQKLYNNNNLPVQSTMISGAEWDQIMIWMKDEKNTNDNTKYYVVDSNYMGNYDSRFGGTGSKQVSGYLNNYSVKKIFDLGGNLYDGTTEAYDTTFRVLRGDSCARMGRGYPASDRIGDNPADDTHLLCSARFTLYVK